MGAERVGLQGWRAALAGARVLGLCIARALACALGLRHTHRATTCAPSVSQGGDDRIFSDHTHASLNLVIPMSSLAVEGGLGGGGRKREDSAVSLGGPDGHGEIAITESMKSNLLSFLCLAVAAHQLLLSVWHLP